MCTHGHWKPQAKTAGILSAQGTQSYYDKYCIMKKIKLSAALIMLTVMTKLFGQDPSFSQFFSSPLNVNPALTAHINSDWRLISNFRDQWIGPASPYMTGTISYDSKIFQNRMLNVAEDDNTAGIGGMLMFDYAMTGIVKSTYASLDASYNIKLADGYTQHRLGAGFGFMYGRRYMDFDRVDFEEQFTGYGFNTNLPTGETALSNMKPYFSLSAGLIYTISTEKSNFDFGIAGFHLNRPKQTFLADENQYLASRQVAHANFETLINDRLIFTANGTYQYQKKARYFSVGGALGHILGEQQDFIFNWGFWYWSNNAVIPYVGLAYKNFQFGVSYDFTISKLRDAPRKPNTWEVSIILRGMKRVDKTIPCPWK
jgi:type IX secretion system PorP/SprF family membrane protein